MHHPIQHMLLLAAAVLIAVTGCKPGTCVDMKEVTYRIARDGELLEGKPATVSVELKNKSTLYMLIQRVEGQALAPGEGGMQIEPRYGSLSRSKDGTEVFHNTMAQQMTAPLFARTLIPPGKKLRFPIRIVPSAKQSLLTVYYRGLTAEDAAKWLLFPPKQEAGAEVKYVKIAVSDLERAVAAAPSDDAPHPMLKTVVVDMDFVQATGECKAELPFGLKPQKRPVEGASLAAKLGEEPSWKVYSETLKGWVAGTSQGVFIFDQTQPHKTVPSPGRLYVDWDKGEKVKVKIGDEGGMVTGSNKPVVNSELMFLEDLASPYAGDGMYTQGTFMDVPPEKARDMLTRLYEKGCGIIVVNYFQDSHYFQVSCKKGHK